MRLNKYLICLFCCVVSIGYSQKTNKKFPLTTIIAAVEQEYNVKFSYSVEDVRAISIEKPDIKLSLDKTIAFLNAKTLLNFKKLDNRYVTVSVLNKTIRICGIVASNEKTTPLLGATVVVNDTQKSILTDQSGRFTLDQVPLNSTISISYIGFETRRFNANQLFSEANNCIPILLSISNEELNQVLIPIFLTTGLQKRLDGSVVLNTKKFGILPGLIEPDILQSIQILPGIESTNESVANINVRGGTNDQNLVIWDNIKMYHSGNFFGLISAYNPNITNKVTVSKNGTTAEYSDGVSSTINMQTKDEISNTVSGGAGINLISADAFVAIPIAKNLELHLSGRRSITDIVDTPTFSNYFKRSFQDTEINNDSNQINTNSDFYFYDYTAKLLFDLNENHKFRATMIGINNALDYSEQITKNTNETESKRSNLSQKNIGFGGEWKAKWNSKWSTKFLTYFSKYNIDAVDYRVETDQSLTEANEVLETAVKFNTTYKVNENLNFLMGYHFNETGMLNQTTVSDPSYERTKKDVLLNHALFYESEYSKKNTYFRVGVRFNYFQKFDKLLIEPRLNLRQKLSNTIALKLEGEFKNQSASQIIDFQDNFLGVEKRRWVLANDDDIPIATSKQGSFGFEFNQKKLTVELSGFYKFVEGITASNQGFYNNFQFIKAHGNYTAKGLEFLANKMARNYSAWLSYTFSTNDYVFESFTPSTFPNNVDIRHSLSLGFNYDILKNVKVSVGSFWRSGQPYTSPIEGNETVQTGNETMVNYDAPNSRNLDNFMRLDASLNYDFALSSQLKASFRLGVINITNTDNVINRYYKVDPSDSNKTVEVDNKSLGITPNMSFRLNF